VVLGFPEVVDGTTSEKFFKKRRPGGARSGIRPNMPCREIRSTSKLFLHPCCGLGTVIQDDPAGF
jgi:hypothetical protein